MTNVHAGWRPTVGQQQMLTFNRIAPGSSWHNVPLYVRITGPLDVKALRRAVFGLVARHESLRTGFPGDGELAVPATAAIEVTEHDLTGLPEAELARLKETELRRTFDLASGPLLRAALARTADQVHELIVTIHHIAVDGTSLTVLCQDLVHGYRSSTVDETATFSAYAQRYHDFVAGELVTEQLEHWRADLAGLPEPAALPFTRPRDASLAAEVIDFRVPDPVAVAVRGLAARQRATPFMVLLTAFGVLLRRYTGADDLIIGTPTAGRDDPEVADLVGYLVNMIPLRLRLAGARTWLDALSTVRDATLDGSENSGVPFARLAEELDRPRSAGTHPLFQIVFAAPPALGPSSTVDGLTFEFGEGTSLESLYDIEVQVIDEAPALRGYLKYRTGLFDRADIERLLDHFLYLTEVFTTDPKRNLADIAVLRPEEYSRVVVDWNDTATGYPRDATLTELFAERVAAAPDAAAVRYGPDELTYAELDVRANRLAHYLRRQGIGAESTVGICVGFGVDWVIGALAAIKAGGAYVPLDTSYPPARLALMCADAGVRVALVQKDFRDHLPAGITLVTLEDAEVAAEPATPPPAAPLPDSLGYVMYTSGSTGRPKGVGVTHRNIIRLVRNTDFVDLGPGDVVAQASNLSFDAATLELWGALLNGALLVGVEREVLLSAPRLAEHLRGNGIGTMFLTTSLARQLALTAPQTVAGLRCLLFGGEAADARLVAGLLGAGGPRLVNGYGPTETTTFGSTHSWPSGTDPSHVDDPVPVGRPIANSTAYVLDPDLQPVGPGRVGEIFLGGDGVARGYVGRADLTAERFLPDPFGRPGSRLYRTGDLGRYRPSGEIECLGRIDRQVKIRGFRIEPGEIESCLHETGRVREVTVQVRQEALLVGYVVPAEPGTSMEDLLSMLRERLPAHLVPAALVAMDALPVNENGKLDVAALPDPGAPSEVDRAGPATDTERTVLAAWQEVLGTADLGVHDDFFLLGGHSIKAGQVMTRIRAVLGIPAPLRLIFDNPTVAELARVLDERLERTR